MLKFRVMLPENYFPTFLLSFKFFTVGAGNFSPHHSVQNGSGAHPASYPMDTGGSFAGDKATGV